MKHKKYTFIVALIALCTMSGCASVAGSHIDSIAVDTPSCPKAACVLKNEDGKYHVKETPDTVTVERAYGDLTVTCKKNGRTKTITVSSKAHGVWGNVLLGGIIGWAVDAQTGAGYMYPDEILHPLKCETQSRTRRERSYE